MILWTWDDHIFFETPLCECKLQNALRSLDQKAHSFESQPELTAETSSYLDILWLLQFWIFKVKTEIDGKWNKIIPVWLCGHTNSKNVKEQLCSS